MATNPFYIKVYYRYSSGRTEPYYSCKVQGQSSYGFTDKVWTDRNGDAVLESVDDELEYIYIDGKSRRGSFYAGNEYRFYVDE